MVLTLDNRLKIALFGLNTMGYHLATFNNRLGQNSNPAWAALIFELLLKIK